MGSGPPLLLLQVALEDCSLSTPSERVSTVGIACVTCRGCCVRDRQLQGAEVKLYARLQKKKSRKERERKGRDKTVPTVVENIYVCVEGHCAMVSSSSRVGL